MLDQNSKPTKGELIKNPLSSGQTRFGCVCTGIVCVYICLITAVAHAQQDATASLAAENIVGGWWSLNRTQSMVAIPRLDLDISKLMRFETPEPQLTWPSKQSHYSMAEYTKAASHTVSELMPGTRGAELNNPAEGSLLEAGSFLSFIHARYLAWEAQLSDSRSLMDINGALVYPLIEIDYPQGCLPISLYIPPLRGSASR